MTSEQTPTERGNVARLVDRLSKDISLVHSTTQGVNLRKAPPQRNATVKYSYLAQHDDELDLKEGDELEILEDVEDGWAKGQIVSSSILNVQGKIGLFPTNFVSINSSLHPSTTNSSSFPTSLNLSRVNEEKSERDSLANGSTSISKNSADPGLNLSNKIDQSGHVLPSLLKNNRRVLAVVTETPPVPPAVATPINSNKKELAKVLYKYEAANSDELSLPEGAIIVVLNKKCEDEGWYEGEYNGKRGLFPENFVKLIEYGPSTEKNSITPPILPAKPNKPIASSSSIMPVATIRDIPISTTSSNNDIFFSGNSKPLVSEDRKSIVAGLQNKLFPTGRLPPQKPLTNVIGASSNNFEEKPDEKNEVSKLLSLTKTRPKQNNKRPPSLSFNATKQPEDLSPSTPPIVTPTKPENVTTKSAARLSTQPNLSTSPGSELSNHLKQLASSSTKEDKSEYVTRSEFEKFSAEIYTQISKLNQEIAELKAELHKD